MIILDSILLFQVLEFICLTYFVLLIIPRNSHERQATQCFTSSRISPIKEDGDTVEIIVDCLLVEISSESTEEPPVFRMLRFFSIRGKKRRGGRSWKEGQETIVCKLFQCPAPSLGSLFHSDGEESRSTGELTERNLGRHLRDHWPTPEILQLVD